MVEARAIEVRVCKLRQLFNSLDPSPFPDKDLDADAEEFIVDWAAEIPRDAPVTPDHLGAHVNAVSEHAPHGAAVAVVINHDDERRFLEREQGESLGSSPAEGLTLFRGVNFSKSDFDLSALYQQGQGVAVSDSYDLAGRGGNGKGGNSEKQ